MGGAVAGWERRGWSAGVPAGAEGVSQPCAAPLRTERAPAASGRKAEKKAGGPSPPGAPSRCSPSAPAPSSASGDVDHLGRSWSAGGRERRPRCDPNLSFLLHSLHSLEFTSVELLTLKPSDGGRGIRNHLSTGEKTREMRQWL